MENVTVLAGDILTALGNLQNTWEKMIHGQTGLARRTQAGRGGASELYAHYPLGLIDGLEGEGGDWLRAQSLLRRLLSNVPDLPPDTSLFIASTKAAVDELLPGGVEKEGQPWHLGEYLQEKLHLSGEVTTVSAACASGSIAIIQAAMAIATGRCQRALVIGVDLVGEFILTGFDALKGLSQSVVRPFDKTRDGLSLGDGGGWVLLTSARVAELESSTPIARIGGWGISCDATHITAPCRFGSGLKLALDQVLATTDIQVGGINAHGTGTIYNDAMELLAFDEKFGDQVPICSVKGAIGHTLGAGGVIEAMLSVQSLYHKVLLPTVGLQEPEGNVQHISGRDALPLTAPSIISCNSGFGGINAAVQFFL